MVSSQGKFKANPTRFASDRQAPKNVGIRDFKVYSDPDKVTSVDGVNAKKPPKTTRNLSLPVKEKMLPLDSSSIKGCVGNVDKSKSGLDGSGKVNVRRKVLADVSNVRNILPKNQGSDGSQLLKDKNKKTGLLQRKLSLPVKERIPQLDSTNLKGCVGDSDRSKSEQVKVKVRRKVLADVSNVRNILPKIRGNDGTQPLKDKSEKSDLLQRVSVSQCTTASRVSSRKSVMGTSKATQNKSIEGPQTLKKVDTRDMKAPSESQKTKGQGQESFGSDARKQARKPSMLTRVAGPARQNIRDAGTFPRKSLRPIGGATVTLSKNQISSKSKCPSGLKKSTFATANSSKKEEKSLTKTISKTVAFVVPDQSSAESILSNRKSGSSINTKNSRRQSFTFSLVSKPEEKKELLNIDDGLNHLEVAEYIDEIYQYYWVMEAQYSSIGNYMTLQTHITPKLRGILVNWLIEVHFKYDLMQETLFLMVALFDRFLSVETIERNQIQLVGLTALLLASKYEDFWHPKVKDLISIAADSYTRDHMLSMEKLILKKLKFRFNEPTPYVFMLRFLKAAQAGKKLEHLAFYLIELCLTEYEALKFKPSLICASAIYVARCTLGITPAWTSLLRKHAHYEASELRVCGEMILRFQKAAGKGDLRVTYDKHMSPDHSCVAAIKPLDRLPQ